MGRRCAAGSGDPGRGRGQPGEEVADLAGAAVWGLVRSAQSENPGRLVLADLPLTGADRGAARWPAALAGRVSRRSAVRGGGSATPAAGPPGRRRAGPRRTAGGHGGWRSPAGARWTAWPWCRAPRRPLPLAAGQVRVAVRAAGLNFRDVLIALGTLPRHRRRMGSEVAGVVLETGPGVTGLAPRGPGARPRRRRVRPGRGGRARLLAPSPGGLVVRAGGGGAGGVRDGLVRAGGPGRGAGRAAAAGARGGGRRGHGGGGDRPGTWAWRCTPPPARPSTAVLRRTGPGRRAHRFVAGRATFERQFLAATGGAGMDIVLNSLAGELTDASLRLLPRGGPFIEMGKTDIRDPGQVAADHPGVRYRAFDLARRARTRLGRDPGRGDRPAGRRGARSRRRCGPGTCAGRRRRSGS